jgi:catechol-2,3-dioxygenase
VDFTPVRFDHAIVPARDKKRSAEFYERILGFEDLGEQSNELRELRIDRSSVLFLEKSTDSDSSPWSQGIHHYAFSTDKTNFDRIFTNLKTSGFAYGASYEDPEDMKGPGKAPGARGSGKTLYFKDPADNLIQIICYE